MAKGPFGWFNRNFDRSVNRYERGLGGIVKRPWPMLVFYGAIVLVMIIMFVRLPTGFLPDEDQGAMITQITLPTGASQQRTLDVIKQAEHHYLVDEKNNVNDLFTVVGFNFSGPGQNAGIAFAKLKNWDVRKGAANRAPGIAQRATTVLSRIRDAQVQALVQPAVPELGQSTGFDLELENRGNLTHDQFLAARNQLLGMAKSDPSLAQVRPNGLEDAAQLKIDVDTQRAGALGVNQNDINSTCWQRGWSLTYVDDFIDDGRVEARVHPGRRAVPQRAGGSLRLACAQRGGDDDAVLVVRQDGLDLRSRAADALQRPAVLRNPGPGGARQEFGRRHGHHGKDGRQAAAGHRLRVDRPVLSGTRLRLPGAAALRPVDHGGLPVSGRAL